DCYCSSYAGSNTYIF
nr:immunoglobulin light chain junction region [Macaca mulatta]